MNAKVQVSKKENKVILNLQHSLDKTVYNLPLTLKSYVPNAWKTVKVKQGAKEQRVQPKQDAKGMFILYQAFPNAEPVELSGA
jgi:hypothetical protein